MISEEHIDVDLSPLREITDGDKQVEKELIRCFIEQSDGNLQELDKSLKDGDSNTWREVSHMLKGAAAGIGAGTLHQLCERAQNLEPSATEEQLALFTQIKMEYEKVRKFLVSNLE